MYQALEQACKRIENAIDWEWFRNLWEANASAEEFWKLAQACGIPIEWKTFEHGWQYRCVLNPSFSQAKKEFVNLLLGWY